LNTTLARIAVRKIDARKWAGAWTGRGNDCMNDPRDCVAQEFRRRASDVDLTQDFGDSSAVVYARVMNAPFDTAAVRTIANDMRRPGAVEFSLSYGYETTLQLAWSPTAREVFVIFSCC
jgi:hypothetical protein